MTAMLEPLHAALRDEKHPGPEELVWVVREGASQGAEAYDRLAQLDGEAERCVSQVGA